jgi:hypothetical protein
MIRCFLLLVLGVQLQAATYYVAKTGNDSNPGTIGSPKLTIQAAANLAVAGDTVKVGDGTYAESVWPDTANGSVGSPITFDGQGVATVYSWVFGHPYHNFINFTVSGGATVFGGAAYIGQNASHMVISNNVFDAAFNTAITPLLKWSGPDAIPFGTAGSDNLLISNVFKNVRGEMFFRLYGDRNVISGNQLLNSDFADFFQISGRSNYIVGNTLSNLFYSGLNENHADIIQIFGNAGGSLFGSRGHLFESNIVTRAEYLSQLGNLTDDSNTNVTDLTIRNNVFVGIAAKASISMPNVWVYNNVFYQCATNLENGGPLLIFADTGANGKGNGGRAFNNIFIDCGIAGTTNSGGTYFSPTLTNVLSDYNYVVKEGKPVKIDPGHRAIGDPGGWDTSDWWEPHGFNGGYNVSTNPGFINISASDFRLLASSPLISAGLNLTNFTKDIRGVTRDAWEIGPYEYSAADFNTYPCDILPRLIQAYSTVASNATTLILPINTNRLEVKIARRSWTNRPSAWGVFTNLYTLNSASVTNVISFTDTNFAGVHYEYEIQQLIATNQPCDVNGYRDYQYLDTGYRVPLIDARGSVIVLVETGKTNSLWTEITQLYSDLRGDGYKVFPHYVAAVEATAGTSWTNAVWATKQLLQTDYALDTNSPCFVFIVGHVPVPYSGETLTPGSHEDNIGAHGTDLFYADLNGTFTDSTANVSTAGAVFTHNVPGDGKFDQDYIPSAPELRIGRVDLGNLPAFSANETELLRQYLNRDHAWRHKQFTVRQLGLIYGDNTTNTTGTAKLIDAHNNLAGYFGTTAATSFGNWLTASHDTNNTYLFAHKLGAGGIDHDGTESVPQLGTAADFAATSLYAVFTATFGSYYGSWDSLNTNAFMKTILANGGYPLAVWYRENYMQLDSSAMDEPIGYEQFAMQSQRFFIGTDKEYTSYVRVVPFVGSSLVNEQHKMYESLLGDPTLRTRQVYPVSNLAVNASGADNVVTWTASADATEGYHVYQASTSDLNNFTRLTSVPTTATSYTDTGAASGSYTYMVRAVQLYESPNRSFYSASQGVFTASAGGGGSTAFNVSASGKVTLGGKVVLQ